MTDISTAYPADCRNGSDLTGVKFNWMTVLGRAEMPEDAPKSIRGSYWLCRCVCGREIIIPRQYIVRKSTKDCGCRTKTRKPRTLSMEVNAGVCSELAREIILKAAPSPGNGCTSGS